MKNTGNSVGTFFAIILVAILGGFFLQTLTATGDGKTLPLENVDLRERVSLHYVLKNVGAAAEYLSQHGREYFANRAAVPSKPVEFGKSTDLEDGAANEVTSIVVDYRGFDTLGEVTVLFISILGVTLLLLGTPKKFWSEPSIIVRTGVRVLFPFIILFGVYIFVHGHLTPGGGFPGGAVISSGILALILGLESFNFNRTLTRIIEGLAGLFYVLIGFGGLVLKNSFLANFLPTGTVGLLISAGFVALIYITIGIKVGAELSAGVAELKEGAEND